MTTRFYKKIQKILRYEHVPMNDEFKLRLRNTLHTESRTEATKTVHKRSLWHRVAMVLLFSATGIATIFFAWQHGPSINHIPSNAVVMAYTTLKTVREKYHEYAFKESPQDDAVSRKAMIEMKEKTDTFFELGSVLSIVDAGKYSFVVDDNGQLNQHLRFGENEYFFKLLDWQTEKYSVYANGHFVFDRNMCFPAERAEDGRQLLSIHNALAVRFFECDALLKSTETMNSSAYTTNMYYDGVFFNEAYNVQNTRFIFVWHDHIGFVADRDGQSYVFFDGKPVSDGFDAIHTQNCCAQFELEPQLYDNGSFVFFAQRGIEHMIVEVLLK